MMSKTSKREYVATIRQVYRLASKATKGNLLSDLRRICGYNRKYAIRLMHAQSASTVAPTKSRAGRKPRYQHPGVLDFLKKLWIASNLACSKRLKAMIPLWLPHDHSGLSQELQTLLQQISASTIDRLLAPLRHKYTKRGLATTKPGSLLKKHIPINTGQWDERRPGFLEADTVAHCGTSMAGMFVFTLNCVDLATSWSEQRALWGKGEQGVLTALQSIEQTLPFVLRGFDCDNGGEFLNWTILKHFQHRKRPVHYTRSREYQKNDNAHVEEKNWTLIRQYLGYDRFEDQRMVALLNDLYTNEWRLLLNFFLPSSKLISKKRLKSKIVKHLDAPLTPYQRLLTANVLSVSKKKKLDELFKNLNPFELQKTMSKKINRIVSLATPAQFTTIKSA
jgi:hypothetical protein